MTTINIQGGVLEKQETSEAEESVNYLGQSSAGVRENAEQQSAGLTGTLPIHDIALGIVDKADIDKSDTDEISEFPNPLDQYFDPYSIDDSGPPIFLEKDLKLSDLGISKNYGWQKISTKEMGGHCGDSVEFMRDKMSDDIVDLVVTSPPYDMLRNYEGYEFDFEVTTRELFRVTITGGVVIWIVGDATINGDETGTSFKHALYFKEIGFKLHDTMIYRKTGTSFPSTGRYTQIFEYMLVFSKAKPKTFNPIKDRPKRWPGSWGQISRRKQDGTLSTKAIGNGCRGSETGVYGYKQRTNVWVIRDGRRFGSKDDYATQHPASFPEELAGGHILTWSNPGDLIFDPMCGSGTTLKMALLHGRNFIGLDVSKKYCEIAVKRLVGAFTKLPVLSTVQALDRKD
ncbi:MAG: site-specific DNA-methyltransferase [Deltaproteobacteria bacterium]|nr:site-specific DNA-methyltransferase [Deltaproteobacteria bacterium]